MDNELLARATKSDVLTRVALLEQQGLVDGSLRQYYELKAANGDDPRFFVNLIQAFLRDVSATLDSMGRIMAENIWDFSELLELSTKAKGSANSLGAMQLSQTCTDLVKAAKNASQAECIEAFSEMERKFDALRTHLDSVLVLEQELLGI